MMVIRPIALADLDCLEALVQHTTFGLTTLPKDRDLLRERIVESQRGFEKIDQKPRGETYLFALEDTATGRIVGTSGIASKVGGFEPFYAYRIETTVHESAMLKVRKEVRTLHLIKEHNGPCEIGSLFLSPQQRGAGNGRLLSLARFLFMAEHPACFDPQIIAEMRGVIDEQGRSPFWDALGRHFFDLDFPRADYLSMINKRFIADLMPTHPIYIPLLPPQAQEVIGQVHEKTRPALKILESEGFRFSGMVDIFEAGPVVICPLEEIRCVRQSVRATVGRIVDQPVNSEPHLIAAAARRDVSFALAAGAPSTAKGEPNHPFRACIGTVANLEDGQVSLNRLTALALGVKVGDLVRTIILRPDSPSTTPPRAATSPSRSELLSPPSGGRLGGGGKQEPPPSAEKGG